MFNNITKERPGIIIIFIFDGSTQHHLQSGFVKKCIYTSEPYDDLTVNTD